jgi:hypothetical protein
MIASKRDRVVITRLPQQLRERLQDRADKSGRSLNSEVIAALEAHLKRDTRFELMWKDYLKRTER